MDDQDDPEDEREPPGADGPEYSEATGRELLRRFLAREPAAEPELVLQLNRLLHRVWRQRWLRYGLSFVPLRGACFELLGRWREEREVKVEPLPHLAQRLMKQCGRQELRERYRDRKNVSSDAGWETPDRDDGAFEAGQARAVERQLAASSKLADPEAALAAKQRVAWLARAREKLSDADRATFDGELAVAAGELPSLHEALGTTDAAARQRRKRMKAALLALAKADGLGELVDRASGGRAPRRDAGVQREGPAGDSKGTAGDD